MNRCQVEVGESLQVQAGEEMLSAFVCICMCINGIGLCISVSCMCMYVYMYEDTRA